MAVFERHPTSGRWHLHLATHWVSVDFLRFWWQVALLGRVPEDAWRDFAEAVDDKTKKKREGAYHLPGSKSPGTVNVSDKQAQCRGDWSRIAGYISKYIVKSVEAGTGHRYLSSQGLLDGMEKVQQDFELRKAIRSAGGRRNASCSVS